MFDQLEIVEQRYEQLNELLSDPDIVSDTDKLREYSKEQADLQETVEAFRAYKEVKQQLEEALEMMGDASDADEQEMIKEEINELKPQIPVLEEKMKLLLIPKDPMDDKNVVMEIRGAAGGDEANIFAGDLFRMYSRFSEEQGWKKIARWIENEKDITDNMNSSRSILVKDRYDQYVFLFENEFATRWFEDKFPEIKLYSLL